MDFFEQKYGIEENSNVKNFHKSRRMFCIYKNKLYIAEPNLSYSHAVWFEKEGWMTKEGDTLINETPRGFVDEDGDIYFYVGYDFKFNKKIEKIFLIYLDELVNRLNLNIDAKLFGGMIKSEPGTKWLPIKDYGIIKNNIIKK